MSKPLSSEKSATENGSGPKSNRIADVSIVAPHPSYALGFVASMSISRQARSNGILWGCLEGSVRLGQGFSPLSVCSFHAVLNSTASIITPLARDWSSGPGRSD